MKFELRLDKEVLLEEIRKKIVELMDLVNKLEDVVGKPIDEISPDFAQALQDLDEYYGYLESNLVV